MKNSVSVFFDPQHAIGSSTEPCETFCSAVLFELGNIYPVPVAWPGNIDVYLRYRFTALQTAVQNFRPFVPWWKRWLFDRAWLNYYSPTGKKDGEQCYHYYMAFDSGQDCKKTFHDRVSRLLSFAE